MDFIIDRKNTQVVDIQVYCRNICQKFIFLHGNTQVYFYKIVKCFSILVSIFGLMMTGLYVYQTLNSYIVGFSTRIINQLNGCWVLTESSDWHGACFWSHSPIRLLLTDDWIAWLFPDRLKAIVYLVDLIDYCFLGDLGQAAPNPIIISNRLIGDWDQKYGHIFKHLSRTRNSCSFVYLIL